MLIIERKEGERVIIADEIEITILEIVGNRVQFGIKAPKHIVINTLLKHSPHPTTDSSPPQNRETT